MGKTWSRGTNSRLPFGVKVNLNLSINSICREVCLKVQLAVPSPRRVATHAAKYSGTPI